MIKEEDFTPGYYCWSCGSKDVEIQTWISPNMPIPFTFTEDDLHSLFHAWSSDNGDTWCNNCQNHDGIVFLDTYEKYKSFIEDL